MKLTSKQLAELASVSDAYIRRLTRDGVLPKPTAEGYDAVPAIRALIQHYKSRNEQAKDLAAAKLEKLHHETALLRLTRDEREGRLVDVELLAAGVNRGLQAIRETILAAPGLEPEDKDKLLLTCRDLWASALEDGVDDSPESEPSAGRVEPPGTKQPRSSRARKARS